MTEPNDLIAKMEADGWVFFWDGLESESGEHVTLDGRHPKLLPNGWTAMSVGGPNAKARVFEQFWDALPERVRAKILEG
jgi:hypothetical protein